MALGDAFAPVVFPDYNQTSTEVSTKDFQFNFPGLSPENSSLTSGGAVRPASGQIYPRGNR